MYSESMKRRRKLVMDLGLANNPYYEYFEDFDVEKVDKFCDNYLF
jgi:hypothetical protein